MPTKIKLCYILDDSKSREFEDADTCIVGRHKDCGIHIPDQRKFGHVSKFHCMFEINPPEIRVNDFGSLNGTCVGGKNIGQRKKGQSAEEGQQDSASYKKILLKDQDRVVLPDGVEIKVLITEEAICEECHKKIPEDQRKEAALGKDCYVCPECRRKKKQGQSLDFMQSTSGHDSFLEQLAQKSLGDLRDCLGDEDPDNQDPFWLEGAESAPSDENNDQENPLAQIDRIMEECRAKATKALPIFEDYEIVKELGRGGMGIVYLVREKATKNELALKLMIPDGSVNPRKIKRFAIEASNTKSLRHPNIVTFLNHGICEGRFYFLLEYCPWGSVDRFMSRNGGTLDPKTAVDFACQSLDGLEHGHHAPVKALLGDGSIEETQGVVHRDIKPHNLFLAGDSPLRPQIKIGDYGLAKAFQLSGLTGVTGPRDRLGTPAFLPRQYAKTSRYAQPDIDVYGVAASLYYMLTKHPPRNFSPAVSPWCTLVNSAPVPIAQRRASVPKRLAALIDTALDDEEELKFKTAIEFKEELLKAI